MRLIISESKNFIIITCQLKDGEVLSWEELQEVKDEFHPNKDFIEIYPKKDEIINKANERHLVHQKGVITPKMENFEEEADVKIIDYFTNRQIKQYFTVDCLAWDLNHTIRLINMRSSYNKKLN